MQTSKRLLTLNLTSAWNKYVISRNVTVAASVIESNDNDLSLKPFSEIPGPPNLPIIGQLHNFLPGRLLSDITNLQDNLYKLYGPISKFDAMLSRQAMVYLFDPEAIAYVLRSENTMPYRPGFPSLEYYRKYHNKPKNQDLLPTGLITDHGENWRYFRTIVNPVMLQPKTIKLYRSLVDDVAEDMVKRMRSIRNEKNMLEGNFDDEMNLWSLESVGVIALGGRLNCLNRELAPDSPEKKLIQCVHDIFKVSNDLDFGLSLWRYFPTRAFKKTMKLYQEQEELAKHFVQKARKEMLANKKPDDEKGILEKLLEIDEKVALIMACDMLFAGVDTAATAVTNTFYSLATNQDKQDKLREELNSGTDSNKYLRACVKESMRLLPVISGNMRLTTKEYNILGYRVPKDTFVIFNHQFLARTDSQFPRSKEFIPERWIEDGELSYKDAHPFAYSPFGFGVRSCIGRRIAELEIDTFVAKVIKNFKVEWFGPPPKIDVLPFLNYFKGPCNFIFKDIK